MPQPEGENMQSELREAIERRGLSSRADDILAMAKEAVRLKSAPGEDAPVGASRLGGDPDLPPGLAWPEKAGRPIWFIAQIDLEEVPEFSDRAKLPCSGRLYFFYDAAEQDAWGFDPKDAGSSAVILDTTPREGLVRRPLPEALAEFGAFEARRLVGARVLTVPPMSSVEAESLGFSDDERTAYAEVLDDVDGELPDHRLLGHADEIQSGMQFMCQLVTHGLYCGDSSGYCDPRAKTLEKGAGDWRLLFQIDSDDDARMMWGDAGRLFYMIRDQDLAEQAFDRAWLVLECY